MKLTADTPLMRQYYDIKARYPNEILLFRVGDFYEMYDNDAIEGAAILGVVQTKRSNGAAADTQMAGFPYHSLDVYLPKLVKAGKRVAVCDQLEDAKLTKKIVRRGVTELVTPGLAINDSLLNNRENNFLAAVHLGKTCCGIALLDVSTGEFLTSEGATDHIDKLLANFSPRETIVERGRKAEFEERFGTKHHLYQLDDWIFTEDTARNRLLKQFDAVTLKGYGVDHLAHGIIAAGATLCYLDLTHHTSISHITALSPVESDRYVRIDKFTARNLELLAPASPDGTTLLDIIDRTVTPMGSRLLKRWIIFPLKNVNEIKQRQQAVAYFHRNPEHAAIVETHLTQMGDMERLVSKVAVNRINPRELVHLKAGLKALQPIRQICADADDLSLQRLASEMHPCNEVIEWIEKHIHPQPPLLANRAGVIAVGVSSELDELREMSTSGKDYLTKIQEREIKQTGITSLKINFNNVFGYYIEVTNTHRHKVPAKWIRKQTLVNAERYITEELKQYETKILGAEERIAELESNLYAETVRYVSRYIREVQTNAACAARIDCLLSFARVAKAYHYVCPVVDNSNVIDIRAGRHPVIEQQLPPESPYIDNDVLLDDKHQQIIIITGPNMAGKSALLRQTALIVLLAQTGSFVPAESARIGYVDKIFTRVGASDNISRGESTFMVEMTEASEILNNLSPRSLVLFDELGRGTSTYDGISIAWAIVEHIHEHSSAKTLFATHYHELNEMEKSFRRIRNYNVSVREINNRVIFMRKLLPGGSEHSFGIHVARMAGMTKSIVHRAGEILKQLETDNRQQDISGKPTARIATSGNGYQLSFYQLDDPLLSQIRNSIMSLDIDRLTPMDALAKLNNIKKIITGK